MTTDSQHGVFRVCVFRLAGHSFAVKLESISEIVPMAALSRPPLLPSILEGFLNVGGTPIPVLRLAELLGLPQDSLELYTPLVILRGKFPMALLVKSVTGIVSASAALLAPLSAASSFNGCVEGQLNLDGEAIHFISVERLLLEKEQRMVSGFQEIEARRLTQADQATP
jgi:purine-binding chemotaxis protein CheW